MKRLKLFVPLFIFAALALLFWYGLKLDPSHMPSALVGRPVPDFELPVLGKPGETATRADLKGDYDYALINVWATWCIPCRKELPYLTQLREQGVTIFGINSKDDPELAVEMLERLGNPYQFSVRDTEGKLGLDLGVYGIPETFLVDGDGIIHHRQIAEITPKTWEEVFLPKIDELKSR